MPVNIEYERTHYRFTPSNRVIGDATCDLLLDSYLPKLFWPLGRPFLYAMMDDALLKAFDFPRPSKILRAVMTGVLKIRAGIIRWLPERRKPFFGTRQKRSTYPEGYKIEELGTFGRQQPTVALPGLPTLAAIDIVAVTAMFSATIVEPPVDT